MGHVIDVDSHWTFPWEFDLKQGPMRKFAADMPDEAGMLTFFLSDDLMRSLPEAERPHPDALFPEKTHPSGRVSKVPDHWAAVRKSSSAADRVAWMDRIGIDYSIVNSAGFASAFSILPDVKERQLFCRMSNDLLAQDLDGHTDRLGPVTYADLHDLDWAIAELTRMRALGSRAFAVRAEPVNGYSLGHPHFDRLWAAVVDLGMIVSVHVGLAPAIYGDWGRLGLDVLDPAGRGAFLRMSNLHRYQAAELMLGGLVFGGVFERHPRLTVLIAELSCAWMPNFVRRVDGLTHKGTEAAIGPWLASASGGEQLRRHVRISPLIGLGDDALSLVNALPGMTVFSSDYPHTEGNADPIALYGDGLAALAPDVREDFLYRTMADSFARMGDPILIPA